MNEPIGVLRLVDPFRAADPWVAVAPPRYRVSVEQVCWPARASDVTRIAAAAAREGARIVHAHGRWANILAVPAARLVRAKAICTFSGPVRLPDALAFRSADAVMCATGEERDGCVRQERVPAAKVCVVHPGVDLARFPPRAPDAAPLIVAVASLFARAGHVTFLEALARVRASIPEVRAVCAGEGPMRPVLEQRIAFLGLRGCVELAGHVQDVPALLARAHVAWTPGVCATLEAMAAGVPAASPLRELVGEDLAVPGQDAAALAERLLAWLRSPKAGKALRQRAEKEFSLDAFLARLGALYDAALAPNRAAA
ncbi:MAG TPA: glycosyltransferase [Terriglobales bacterium]|nr:glycosyltransferase [Terriglobales bacterium]